jgi:AraC-like DNA-binding protein
MTAERRSPLAQLRLGNRHFDALHVRHSVRRFDPHFYDRFAIGLVESGDCRISTPRGTWVARPGSLLTFSPGEMHTAEILSDTDYSYRLVYVTSPAQSQLGVAMPEGKLRYPVFRSPVLDAPAVARVFRSAHQAIMDDCSTREVSGNAEEQVLSELRDLVKRHLLATSDIASSERLVTALERVATLLTAPTSAHPSVKQMAEECNLSVFHFIRVFRRHFGASPYAYYLAHRVNRARQLLHDGLPMTHVAYECGFSDQSHLTRTFKRTIGLPPGEYRKGLLRPAA